MKRNKIIGWIPFVVTIVFLVFVSCIAGRFANQDVAQRALTTNGFTNIKLVERSSIFAGVQGCDKADLTVFTFSATNAIGKTVKVNVCQGWPIKGATIRSL